MNEQRKALNEYWNDVVIDFLSSGLSQKDYANQNNLKSYSLGYWVRKHNTGFNGFIEAVDNVGTKALEPLTSSIEILVNKMKITIKDYYDEELLLELIRTIRKV